MKVLTVLISIIFIVTNAHSQNTRASALQLLRQNCYTIFYDGDCSASQSSDCYTPYLTFVKGKQYKVYSSSDDGNVKDVDIWLYDSNGYTIYSDTDGYDWSRLAWTQLSDKPYRVRMKNIRSDRPYYSSTLWVVIGER